MLTKEQEESVIDLCRKLIQAQSYSGQEKKVSDILSDYFKANKFDDVIIDKYGNTIGVLWIPFRCRMKRNGHTIPLQQKSQMERFMAEERPI